MPFLLQVKPDLNTTLPVRQTASIFKQPVTKITNHPNNKVKTDPQKAVDQPKQVSGLCVLTKRCFLPSPVPCTLAQLPSPASSLLQRQEDLVQNVRRRLEEALMADSLAHIEDVTADEAVDKVEKTTQLLEKEEL
ncbi:hypothetical protein GOODEAATRI_000802 [Goodea atripinnis]|uniref:Methyl-CpG-binding domain-containing protein n=1 Tax=Goodea atripinnis TaxID=208336 RepID=A0ABV0PJX1_9TELE